MLPVLLTDTVTTDLDRALHYVTLWGLEGVDLRFVGSEGERVPHVNEARLIRRLGESDLPIAAINPGLFEGPVERRAAWMNELQLLKEAVAFCRRTGCRNIVVSAFEKTSDDLGMLAGARAQAAEVFSEAGKIAAAADLHLLVLNERETLCETARETARLVMDAGGAGLGAAWSPAEALAAGEGPEAGWQEIQEIAGLVRVRDYDERGTDWIDVLPGTGALPWDFLIRLMAGQGYAGPVSLEVHPTPKPQIGLRAATSLVGYIRASGVRSGSGG